MTRYKCSECGAEDSDHQPYAPPPAALICWNCRAGNRNTVADQVAAQYGMMPIHNNVEEEIN